MTEVSPEVQKVADTLRIAQEEVAGFFDLRVYLEKTGFEPIDLYDQGPYGGYIWTITSPKGKIAVASKLSLHGGEDAVEKTDVVVGPWVTGFIHPNS